MSCSRDGTRPAPPPAPLSRHAVRARPRPQRHGSQWVAPQGGAKRGRWTRMFVESGRGAAGRGAGLGGECRAVRGGRSALGVSTSARAALRVRELRGAGVCRLSGARGAGSFRAAFLGQRQFRYREERP